MVTLPKTFFAVFTASRFLYVMLCPIYGFNGGAYKAKGYHLFTELLKYLNTKSCCQSHLKIQEAASNDVIFEKKQKTSHLCWDFQIKLTQILVFLFNWDSLHARLNSHSRHRVTRKRRK